jgi:hypothetical protein
MSQYERAEIQLPGRETAAAALGKSIFNVSSR